MIIKHKLSISPLSPQIWIKFLLQKITCGEQTTSYCVRWARGIQKMSYKVTFTREHARSHANKDMKLSYQRHNNVFFSEHNPIIYESACLPRTAEAREGILLFMQRFVVNLRYFDDMVRSTVEWTSFPTPISIHRDLRRNHISLRASRQWFCHLSGAIVRKFFDIPPLSVDNLGIC